MPSYGPPRAPLSLPAMLRARCRGTEQVKWKDIATDLNLTPCSLNPERLDANAGLPFTVRVIKSVMRSNDGEVGWGGVGQHGPYSSLPLAALGGGHMVPCHAVSPYAMPCAAPYGL